MEIKCSHCGTKYDDSERFCPTCGRSFSVNSSKGIRGRFRKDDGGGASESHTAQGSEDGGDGSGRPAVSVTVIIAAVFLSLIIGVTGGFMISRKPDPESAPGGSGNTSAAGTTDEEQRPDSGETGESETGSESKTAGAEGAVTESAQTESAQTESTQTESAQTESAGSEYTESMVSMIREDYNDIRSRTDSGQDTEKSYEGITAYYYNGKPEKIVVPAAVSATNYTEYYYYKNGSLIFAYYVNTDSYWYYFMNERLIRIRYCADTKSPENAVDSDREQSAEGFDETERKVIALGRDYIERINRAIEEEEAAKKAAEEEAAKKAAEEEARKKAEEEAKKKAEEEAKKKAEEEAAADSDEYEDTESLVSVIREDYNDIRSRTDSGQDTKKSYGGMTAYYYNGKPEMIMVPEEVSATDYTEIYYYKNGKLIFAYYGNEDSYRYYFANEKLIRIRYCEDKTKTADGVNRDREQYSEELDKEGKKVKGRSDDYYSSF